MGCCGGAVGQQLSQLDYSQAIKYLETDALFKEVYFATASPFGQRSQWRSDWVNCFVYFDGNRVDPRTAQSAVASEKRVDMFLLNENGNGFELGDDGQPVVQSFTAEKAVRIFVPANYFLCEDCYIKERAREWWIL